MNDAENGLWKMLEPYLKYFWIYLENMFSVFFELSEFNVELMTVSIFNKFKWILLLDI